MGDHWPHVAQFRDGLWVSSLKLASFVQSLVPFTVERVAADTNRTALECLSLSIDEGPIRYQPKLAAFRGICLG